MWVNLLSLYHFFLPDGSSPYIIYNCTGCQTTCSWMQKWLQHLKKRERERERGRERERESERERERARESERERGWLKSYPLGKIKRKNWRMGCISNDVTPTTVLTGREGQKAGLYLWKAVKTQSNKVLRGCRGLGGDHPLWLIVACLIRVVLSSPLFTHSSFCWALHLDLHTWRKRGGHSFGLLGKLRLAVRIVACIRIDPRHQKPGWVIFFFLCFCGGF